MLRKTFVNKGALGWRQRSQILGFCFLLIGLASIDVPATVYANDQFCGSGVRLSNNYARPLERLPRVRTIPDSGILSFGPKRLYLEQFPFSSSRQQGHSFVGQVLLPGGSKFGYSFRDSEYSRRGFALGWGVTAQMYALNGNGVVRRQVGRKRIRIEKVSPSQPPRMMLQATPEAGLYRFDIQFKDRSGRLLGSFKDYLRVVHPRFQARLVISESSLRQGEWIAMRIDNLGTKTVTFDEDAYPGFEVQRFDGSEWVEAPVPELPTRLYKGHSNRVAGFPNIYAGIPAGWATGCIGGFGIPPEYEPGLYRVLKLVQIRKRRGVSPLFNLSTEFHVID